MIPYGRQDLSQQDIDAVVETLKSDWLTTGPMVPKFEVAVAKFVGAGHAVAMNSATSALHAACSALGLGPGDWLWTVPNTFVASANCAIYCGAKVDFVDIDAKTLNMSVDALEERLKKAEVEGRLPKIIVPVHFAGRPCDMPAIKRLADRFGIKLIEDASHAIGARIGDEPVGSCRYSDVTVFSFHPVKIITTAEGGMALTNDAGLAKAMARFRSHGITRDRAEMHISDEGTWYYEQLSLGYNYRITDIQCALGLSQLNRLENFIRRREQIAARYQDALKGLPLILPEESKIFRSSWHLYAIQIDPDQTSLSRRSLFDGLRERGIGVNVHYIPVHLQPFYRALGFSVGQYPNAEQYYQRAISIPMYAGLTDSEVQQVIELVRSELTR